jgi:poly(3-hydroxybutyrate) depolymerase
MCRFRNLSSVIALAMLLCRASIAQEAPPTNNDPLGPGDHTRTLMMGEQKRTYLVHVPKGYDPKKTAPVVLALHGAAMDGSMMVWFSGLKGVRGFRLYRGLSERNRRGAVSHMERWRFQRQDG